MHKRLTLIVLCTTFSLWSTVTDITHADWFVSPSGSADASGREGDPIDLGTALSSSGPVKPGELVLLKEGIYEGRFVSTVSGTADSPVLFWAEPGTRVTIDGKEGSGNQALHIKGEWVQFWNLEITNTSQSRTDMVEGVRFDAPNSKLINSVIHNNLQGIGFWSPAINSELYGNIIFNNGTEGETRGHGHAIYTQNQTGTKQIRNNIIFFGYGFGIHTYTENGYIQGYNFERNVWFRAGASVNGSSTVGQSDGLLIGGLQPVDRVIVKENYSWVPVPNARSVRFGWGGSVENEFIEVQDNYFAGNVVTQGLWKNAMVEGNHFFGAEIGPDPEEFPNNVFSNQLPTCTKTVFNSNRYDPRRIDLIIYNWDNDDFVPVNFETMITSGTDFTVHSVFDIWGEPVLEGKYQGGSLHLPMGSKLPPQPSGFPDAIVGDDIPGKCFEIFVVRSGDDSTSSVKNKLTANCNNSTFTVKLVRNTTLKITNLGSPVTGNAELTIYSLSGRIAARHRIGNLPVATSHEYQIPATIQSGMYIYTLKAGNMVYSRPFVL
ncbi:MAG TPA: right-handed parallel beta-helix repeat-containing protein [Chitinispirillaceae bacterium]|nr:right-handed parallel beta-helix repeat-containing protein [Chitinispirillaceae bacterium]